MYFREVGTRASLLIAVPVTILVVGALIWSVFSQREGMTLLPSLPAPTAVSFSNDGSPITVSFTDLNDDPVAYLNQVIVVSGSYLPVKPADCLRYSGPIIKWSLTAENLQLDALGYERIVRLIPVGTPMTVQGIWRLYQGPLGCGKGPPNGTAWYLDVRKILQPNPLIGEGGQTLPNIIGNGDPDFPDLLPTLDQGDAALTTTVVALTVTAAGTETLPQTPETQVTSTPTPTIAGALPPTATVVQTSTIPVPTETAVAVTSVPGATMTLTPTSDPAVATATLTPELPPVPATSTDVPDGYPGPTETVVPTPSPDPYP